MSLERTLQESAKVAIALYKQYRATGKISQAKFERYVAKIQRNTGVKA